MAIIVSHAELMEKQEFFLKELVAGKLFVYPTDTIYGIGCNAQKIESVKKIRELKQRDTKPFSIIPPSFEWITQHCQVTDEQLNSIQQSEGKETFLVPVNTSFDVSAIAPDKQLIGIRVSNHWFTKLIEQAQVAFITTSVNISGEPHILDINQIPDSIRRGVDYIIDDGIHDANPSRITDLTTHTIVR